MEYGQWRPASTGLETPTWKVGPAMPRGVLVRVTCRCAYIGAIAQSIAGLTAEESLSGVHGLDFWVECRLPRICLGGNKRQLGYGH